MPLLSPNLSLSEFVDAVNPQVVGATENDVAMAEHASFKAKGAADFRKRGSVSYAEKLKGLLFLLRTGTRPLGLVPYDFTLLRPIVESLVKETQLKPDVLQIFEG